MRNVMINTVEEDYVGMGHAKGLRDRRVMTMYAGRNAILPPLTGFASQFGAAVGGLVFIEFVFSYPGVGLTLQQAALGSDYPLTQALLLVLAVLCADREPDHGPALRRPRPAGAHRVSNLADLELVAPAGAEAEVAALGLGGPRRRFRVPLWARLLLGNWKSRLGLVIFGTIVGCALAAPWLATNTPSDIVGLPGQPPSREFFFGTTDQGYDVFSQVVWGARQSLAVGALAAILSTTIAVFLGLLAAYRGGLVDDVINLVTNVFLVIPTLPLLIVIASFVENRGPVMLVLIIG